MTLSPKARKAYDAGRPRSGQRGAHVTPRIKIAVDDERRAAWTRAARACDMDLAEWIRAVADEAARRVQARGPHDQTP